MLTEKAASKRVHLAVRSGAIMGLMVVLVGYWYPIMTVKGERSLAVSSSIHVVAAENEYGDLAMQIGGTHVQVDSIINNPAVDPHTYESNTGDARAVAEAQVLIVNGLGYDDFMSKLNAASPNSRRQYIDVGQLMKRQTGVNPHQWYDPTTLEQVATSLAQVFSALDPHNQSYYVSRQRHFVSTLAGYRTLLARVKQRYHGAAVAVSEPVFGYALAAAGLRVVTPLSFQLAVQEGNDPAPQDVQTMQNLLSSGQVKVFCYNQQAVTPITTILLATARAHHVPIVGVYETEPAHMSLQQWMIAEMTAVQRALQQHLSTEVLH